VFEAFDIAPVSRVRPEPLREVRFVLDVHLGRLARLLRLVGFDALYLNDAPDSELASCSAREHRVLLTRDRALLKRREVTHGYSVRSASPFEQLVEVLDRFQLRRLVRPFSRCTRCNSLLRPAPKETVAEAVPPRSYAAFDEFLACDGCGRVYWRGSHYERLVRLAEQASG
jgi:uncharacterized protein with PIN domain